MPRRECIRSVYQHQMAIYGNELLLRVASLYNMVAEKGSTDETRWSLMYYQRWSSADTHYRTVVIIFSAYVGEKALIQRHT